MKLLLITAQTPYGKGEAFILEEILEMRSQRIDLIIIPRNPSKEVFHKKAKELLENTIWLPLINFKMMVNFLKVLLTKILPWIILGSIIRHSRNLWIFIKDLAIFPKAVFIAKIIEKAEIQHIHAHWGSTTATVAYFVSKFTNIPWSFTLHRWDIKENNLLKEKVKSAQFIRCISEHGKRELLEIVGKDYEQKIKVLHMGVKIASNIQEFSKNKKKFIIATPANFLEVKGHRYLIEACSNLLKQGIENFQCIFFGEGPLKDKLEKLIKEKELTKYVKMVEAIPHEKLMEMYKNKKIDLIILPSITTEKSEHEGIPVSLMEAMAYKIPVISTNTGGIPELLSNGAGVIVKEKSPEELKKTIIKVMKKEGFAKGLSQKAYQRIQEKFNIEKNTKILLELIRKSL